MALAFNHAGGGGGGSSSNNNNNNNNNNSNSGTAPTVSVGAPLPEVDTENLGFKPLGPAKEANKKVKLLPSPWPQSNPPPASASLLSVASTRGYLAAAGPDALVIASTRSLRQAFGAEADEHKVISDFTPDVTLPVPQLRHVAFSCADKFLVISSEATGGLTVFNVDDALQKKEAGLQVSTESVPVRALLPNPSPASEHLMAVVLDSGRVLITDISKNQSHTLREDGATCAAWSVKGKAMTVGLSDGTAAQYMLENMKLRGVIPRPPGVHESFIMSAVYWLNNQELFLVHSPRNSDASDTENTYHFVKTDPNLSSFTFRRIEYDPLFASDCPVERGLPPRFSVIRLRNWKPFLDDMLILTNSHTPDIAVITSTSERLAPNQEEINDYVVTQLADTRKAQVPRMVFGSDGDSVLIGEDVDLSSTEQIEVPVPTIGEIEKSPFPLPAYLVLTHEGLLDAWWIVFDKSISIDPEPSYPYPGLIHQDGQEPASQVTPAFSGATPESKSTPALDLPDSLSSEAHTSSSLQTSSFGRPAFGTSTFGGGSTASSFGKPSQPAFGATSTIGASGGPGFSGFGNASTPGNKQSPWGSSPQAQSQGQANPFAASASGSSGFAKFGTNTPSSGSAFSSFGSAPSGQSPFSALGQQKSAFAGNSSDFKGLSAETSFASTVTVGSGTGSTLPSWANTPAQQGGSAFGQPTSSFSSTQESDMSDADDAQYRERDGETPTPQSAPKPAAKGLFGAPATGFQIESTFKPADSTQVEQPGVSQKESSLFDGGFASALEGTTSKPPTTPIKQGGQGTSSQDPATTPASPPQSFSATPAQETTTPKAPAPPEMDKSPIPEDAPLPPDPMSFQPPKTADDDLPPLAGSPAIKVEAPESDIPSSPLDDAEEEEEEEDEGLSVEEGDEETEGLNPPNAVRSFRPSKSSWALQESIDQSPRIYPAAPTPPAVKSGTSSQSGRSASPALPSVFGQQHRPTGPSPFSQQVSNTTLNSPQQPLFGHSSKTGQTDTPNSFAKPGHSFAALNQNQETPRTPNIIRAASASQVGTRREPLVAPGAPLSASVQHSKPPTPQVHSSELEDEEYDRLHREFARPVEPSRTLDPFVAHKDYSGQAANKTGHAAQIELIYRDINSMVDTLGLNSRSLQSFIKYHQQRQHHSGPTRAVFDVVNDEFDSSWFEQWSLCDVEGLKTFQNELEEQLDKGRVQNVLEKLGQLSRLFHEKAKLMTRLNEVRRQIISRKDSEKIEALRKAPLPRELADSQKTLRNDYARLLTLLGQAEEAAILLRSRLASYNAQNGRANAMPTVDAVKKTIIKMTSLAEKKNNDLVLLESQLRKVGLTDTNHPSPSDSRLSGTPSRQSAARGSLRGTESPWEIGTPPTNRSRVSLRELNRRAVTPEVDSTPSKGYGLSYTPGDNATAGYGMGLARVSDLVDDNLEALKAAGQRRKRVANGLKKVLVERGAQTTRME